MGSEFRHGCSGSERGVLKVLLTGASGFLAGHVAPRLLNQEGIQLLGVSRTEPKVTMPWMQVDLKDDVQSLFDSFLPDIVIHLAWGGLPNYRSMHHIAMELPKSFEFLAHAVQAGVKRIVPIGTCFEYGMLNGQLTEHMTTVPDNPYGFAKLTLLQQLQFLKREVEFELVWPRLFYMFGEGQASSSLYSQFRAAVEANQESFDMSGGEQLRDYLPVTDVADYIVEVSIAEKELGIVNICSGSPISVRSLVEGWKDDMLAEIKLNLGHYPYPDYEPMAFWGCNQKLTSAVGSDRLR